ncbi:MAG: alpha/beta hydrolase [Bacteroidales bacterium]|nr:alpha/beta hydrolase [Bacteroidales bacterium]
MNIIKTFFATAAVMLAAVAVFAQPNTDLRPQETVLLYADSFEGNVDPVYGKKISFAGFEMANDNRLSGPEIVPASGNISNISRLARVDLYFPEKPNGQMVIVCPGGGYAIVSSYNEGVYVADWMLKQGITVAVVKYRLPNGNHGVPYEDVANAFRYCRNNAKKWNVDQIGVMGFSAGGHLAATASNLWTDAITRPDFSILIYPVITLTPGTTHHGTHKNLLGEKRMVQERYMDKYSLEKQAGRQTPPTFLALCSDDKTVPAENSLIYYNRLIEMDVPTEMHIWPSGEHGWGFSSEEFTGKGKDKFAYAREDFYELLAAWLKNLR